MMDLPGELAFSRVDQEIRVRNRGGKMKGRALLEVEDDERKDVRHYDADVLTKVIVYCGIGVLACELLPIYFHIAVNYIT
jgi:3-mercaptopyruvate sulfurtransferase SseA